MSRHSLLFAPAAAMFTAVIFFASASEVRAEPLVVTGRATAVPVAEVSHVDLDLASAAGRERLDNRIHAAVRMLCGGEEIAPVATRVARRACAAAALRSAEPQVAAAIRADMRAARGAAIALADAR